MRYNRPVTKSYAAALEAIPPRAAQVILRGLAPGRPLSEAAAFYGVPEASFAALLARSLVPLLRELGVERADEEVLAARLLHRQPAPPDRLGELLAGLSAAIPELQAKLPAAVPEPWWSTVGRLALVAALIAAALWLSRFFP